MLKIDVTQYIGVTDLGSDVVSCFTCNGFINRLTFPVISVYLCWIEFTI